MVLTLVKKWSNLLSYSPEICQEIILGGFFRALSPERTRNLKLYNYIIYIYIVENAWCTNNCMVYRLILKIYNVQMPAEEAMAAYTFNFTFVSLFV